jgi:hypothetical protein
MMNRNEILDLICECIGETDEAGLYGVGDKLLDVIHALQREWNIDTETGEQIND